MKTGLLTMCAAALGLAACAGGSTTVEKDMAIQLYSLRSLIGSAEGYAQNHQQVFAQLKDMGYTAVEAASFGNGLFYGVTPQQFKADVEAAGLTALSSHVGHELSAEEVKNHDFTAALEWWSKAIEAHKAAGMKYMVTPYSSLPETLQELQVRCEYYNEIGKLCKAAGLSYGYHSHSHEFRTVEGVKMLDYMIEHTDPSLVFFQMDVFWAVWGQQSPVEYFEKYPGRFKMLHIKDKYQIGGSGMVGFDAIFTAAPKAGMEYFVVELENMPEGQSVLDGIRESAEYLRAAPFVK